MDNLMGDIVNFEGGSGVVGTLDRSGWRWRQRLTQKDWSRTKEWQKKNQSCCSSGGKDDWQKFWET